MHFRDAPAYKLLAKHKEFLGDTKILDLFKDSPGRFDEFSREDCGVLFDFSKNLIDKKTLGFLVKMAEQCALPAQIRDLFDGVKLNFTENRAAMHTALRALWSDTIMLSGRNIKSEIQDVADRCASFADKVRSGDFKGATGARILDVVNIGIGGSFLGPKMAVRALAHLKTPLMNFHFVSNIDAAEIQETLGKCSPESTLFIVSSKTFTTAETMANARDARAWVVAKLGAEAVRHHFAAVSSNAQLAREFGVDPKLVFPFGDYVGGRYSMWGPTGLPIEIAIGSENFAAFLAGARAMDGHFRNKPMSENIPVLMALVSVWNNNFLGAEAEAVLPYSSHLEHLPSYLQQLVMESNGKSARRDGSGVPYETSPVIFGEAGTNGQHSFYQLLHQGTRKILCDFIIVAKPPGDAGEHGLALAANGIAQGEALMRGTGALVAGREKLSPFKAAPGNRPSNTFLIERITPATLGAIIAMFEHKTFSEAMLWEINPFDQFGVELGKKLALDVMDSLKGKNEGHDSSTSALIERVRKARKSS